jgi:glycosyltransferase involved in cell wall biosynthesis
MKRMYDQQIQRQPLVSVIMPAYNATEYMAEAIQSILDQTYERIELIVVNDQSTDATYQLAKKYVSLYPKKVKVVSTPQQTNAAGNGAMNYGLKFAKGEYVARMDADDVAFPERISKQVAYLESHPDVIVLGSQAVVVDSEGIKTGVKEMPVTHEEIYEQYGVFHPLIHPTVMYRRSALPNRNQIYKLKFDVNDDYYTFFSLLRVGKFHNLNEPLLYYRIHGKNLSLNQPKSKFLNSVRIRFHAMREFDYKMSLRAWVLMIMQLAVILPMPEKAIVPLYMIVRGISRTSLTGLFIRQKVHKALVWK